MSLRDNINNTNIQKDKLKIGKRNIDNTLINIGGEKSTNIEDVPEKITNAIKQYKKISIIDLNFNDTGNSWTENINIPINLSFLPNKYIIFLEDKGRRVYLSNIDGMYSIIAYDEISVSSLTDKNLNIKITYNSSLYKNCVTIKKLIAIG